MEQDPRLMQSRLNTPPTRTSVPAAAEEEEEELEEPEEGDTAGMVKFQAAKLLRSGKKLLGKNAGAIQANLPKIALALALLVLCYWYFVLRPQPGTLTVSAFKIDEDDAPLAGSAVLLSYADGTEAHADTIIDEVGMAVLRGVPSETDLTLRILPANSKDFETYVAHVRLSSGGNRKIEAKIGKKTGLKFTDNAYSLVLSAGCQQTLHVSVDNTGTGDALAELVPNEDLAPHVKVLGGPELVASGTGVSIPVLVSASEEGFAGLLRLKKTTRAVEVNTQTTASAAKLDVKFVKSGAQDFSVSSGDLPSVQKSQILIKNTGSADAPALSDVNISVSGDFAPWVILATELLDEANSKNGIASGKEAIVTYTVTVPAGTPKGPYTGLLRVTSACDEQILPLNVEVS